MFTARYGLNPYIKPTLFVFKGYALKPPRYMIIELYIIYLPCCLARECDTLAAFESKLAVTAIMWLTNSGTHIVVYLSACYAPVGNTSKEKTLGFTRVYAQ